MTYDPHATCVTCWFDECESCLGVVGGKPCGCDCRADALAQYGAHDG